MTNKHFEISDLTSVKSLFSFNDVNPLNNSRVSLIVNHHLFLSILTYFYSSILNPNSGSALPWRWASALEAV